MIELQRASPIELPYICMKIPAGPPASAEDSYIEDRIDLSEYLAPRPDRSFLIRVEGESMIDLGIFPDDLLVVERGAEAKNNDVVVAMVGGQFTVKQFKRYRGNLWLVPANKSYPEPRQQDFSIWGVVRFALHKLCLILALLAGAAAADAQVFPAPEGELKTEYDRFTGKTKVRMYGVQVADLSLDSDYVKLYLSVYAEYKTGGPTPTFVMVGLSAWSPWGYRFKDEAALDAILDGERKSFGDFENVKREVINGKYVDYLVGRMAYADLLALTRAKTIEMRVGKIEFAISGHAQKMLQNFPAFVHP